MLSKPKEKHKSNKYIFITSLSEATTFYLAQKAQKSFNPNNMFQNMMYRFAI
jgi:hypothetical protein